MCMALWASRLWLRYATLQNLIPSFPWIAPHALHPGAIQGKEEIKFCHLATLLSGEPVPYPAVLPLTISPGGGAAGESVHRVMDVFELHKNKFRAVQRRVCLNDAEPISDCVSGASSDCKIHCCGK